MGVQTFFGAARMTPEEQIKPWWVCDEAIGRASFIGKVDVKIPQVCGKILRKARRARVVCSCREKRRGVFICVRYHYDD